MNLNILKALPLKRVWRITLYKALILYPQIDVLSWKKWGMHIGIKNSKQVKKQQTSITNES